MSFFYIIHIAVCVFLILIILFQDGKTGGLVSVADTGNSVFGAQGASSFLTKLTSGIAIVFMCTSVFLAFMNAPGSNSIADDYTPPAQTDTSSVTQPGVDAEAGGALMDASGNPINKSLSDSIESIERFKADEVPAEVRESFELQKKEEAGKKADAAKADAKKDAAKPKTDADKPKTETPKKEDQ